MTALGLESASVLASGRKRLAWQRIKAWTQPGCGVGGCEIVGGPRMVISNLTMLAPAFKSLFHTCVPAAHTTRMAKNQVLDPTGLWRRRLWNCWRRTRADRDNSWVQFNNQPSGCAYTSHVATIYFAYIRRAKEPQSIRIFSSTERDCSVYRSSLGASSVLTSGSGWGILFYVAVLPLLWYC